MPKISAFTRLFENKKESRFGSQNMVGLSGLGPPTPTLSGCEKELCCFFNF